MVPKIYHFYLPTISPPHLQFYRFSTVNHHIHRKMGSNGSAPLTHTRARV